MAGIYIHIPFCKKACHYCNFHFSTGTGNMKEMMSAIVNEAALRKVYIDEPVETIYFGGGTPSLVDINDLQSIIQKIKSLFAVKDDVEITLEANPDDIDAEKLHNWKQAGINRLSIGVQSFAEEELQWMNRAHTAAQAINCINAAKDAGFGNITIDLIYGTPTLTDEQWYSNLQQAIALGIPHLSCYALTVEPKTALEKMIQQHKKENVDAEKQGRHFELLMQWMQDAGYEHYEISNFAKPCYRSKHNSSYWQGKNYLGLGPSAHSFNGSSRQWNINNNALYLKSILNNELPFEIEYLTPVQRLNEYIMTSLRTSEGISLRQVRTHFGSAFAETLLRSSAKWRAKKNMVFQNENLILTSTGKLLADGIAADLFN